MGGNAINFGTHRLEVTDLWYKLNCYVNEFKMACLGLDTSCNNDNNFCLWRCDASPPSP